MSTSEETFELGCLFWAAADLGGGGKVLGDATFSLQIGNKSGVAEYLAAAVQMKGEGAMFEPAQKQAKAAARAKAPTLHSIAAMMRERGFAGRFNVAGVSYIFRYSPESAAVAGGKLQLIGDLTVIDARPNTRVPPHRLRSVRATLVATQGGVGTAPPRNILPAEISDANPDLPVVESTGSLSFCGVLYFKLAPLDGRALGVPADMRQLQLNVRLAPVSDGERALQGAFSSVADALYGKRVDVDAGTAAVSELNQLLGVR